MLLLYVMSSGDEWEMHMYRMMDATDPESGLVRDDFSLSAVFSIVWMFVGSFFAMNLFVGVIVDNFNQIKSNEDGSATMTEEQRLWVQTMKALAHSRPSRMQRPPDGACRKGAYNLVNSQLFDAAIMLVIVLNVGLMACDYWGIERDHDVYEYYDHVMDGFCYIYYCEATLKLTGLGVSGYFADGWNRFDFTLVCTSLLDQFVRLLATSSRCRRCCCA